LNRKHALTSRPTLVLPHPLSLTYMTEIRRNSRRSNNIVTSEFVDEWTEFQQHGKRLPNASASSEDGNFLGGHGAGGKGASCGLGSVGEFSNEHGRFGFGRHEVMSKIQRRRGMTESICESICSADPIQTARSFALLPAEIF
jgi:hypothetical protein